MADKKHTRQLNYDGRCRRAQP